MRFKMRAKIRWPKRSRECETCLYIFSSFHNLVVHQHFTACKGWTNDCTDPVIDRTVSKEETRRRRRKIATLANWQKCSARGCDEVLNKADMPSHRRMHRIRRGDQIKRSPDETWACNDVYVGGCAKTFKSKSGLTLHAKSHPNLFTSIEIEHEASTATSNPPPGTEKQTKHARTAEESTATSCVPSPSPPP